MNASQQRHETPIETLCSTVFVYSFFNCIPYILYRQICPFAGYFIRGLRIKLRKLRIIYSNCLQDEKFIQFRYLPMYSNFLQTSANLKFADLRFADHIFLRFADQIIFCGLKLPQIHNFSPDKYSISLKMLSLHGISSKIYLRR
jgi:hypothetical protein